MPSHYLLLLNPADRTGFAVELEGAPVREGGPPRPFTLGPAGKEFDITLKTDRQGENLRELQLSAETGGHLAYELLYAEGYVRHEAAARFRLKADGLTQIELGNVIGHSGDLLFALAVTVAALPQTRNHPPFAATGVLNEQGRIQSVEGVPAKLRAALTVLPPGGKVFYPLANAQDVDSHIKEEAQKQNIALIPVERLDEAVAAHLGVAIEKSWLGAPYRRLESFSERDRRIFFGREADVVSLAEKLAEREQKGRPGVLILGASGRGKSSLVQAGLLPYLKQTAADRNLLSDIWNPGTAGNLSEADFAASLRHRWSQQSELNQLAENHGNSPDNGANPAPFGLLIRDLAAALPSNARFVWVINQMEELFTQGLSDAVLDAFCSFLHGLQRQGVWVIGTLRSEFYSDYERQRYLLDMFDDGGLYSLRELNATALERVIRGPAELSGLRFETESETGHNLALQLRDDALSGGTDVLPLLEVTLDQLYERRDMARGLLTFDAYRKIGGLQGAIGTHADGVIAGCSREERMVLSEVLGRLIRFSGDGLQARRQRARLRNFRSSSAIPTLLDKLISGRLLISERNENGEPIVELTHDCLLSHWSEVRRAITFHRVLLEDKRKLVNSAGHWESEGRPKGLLLSSASDVIRAEVVVACIDSDIDGGTTAFLQESVKMARTGLRIAWILLSVVVVSCTPAFIAGNSALSPWMLNPLEAIAFNLSPVLLCLYRSVKPRPYLETARVDLAIFYGYLGVFALLTLESLVSKRHYPDLGDLGYLIALIPPILVVRAIVLRRRAAKALLFRDIGELSPKGWFDKLFVWLPSGIWSWRKIEIIAWTGLILLNYMSWPSIKRSQDYKEYSGSMQQLMFQNGPMLAELLQRRAELSLQRRDIGAAKKDLDHARKTLLYSGATPATDGSQKAWHDESKAEQFVAPLLNSCRLLSELKDYRGAIQDCRLASEIAGYWTHAESSRADHWQAVLCATLRSSGRKPSSKHAGDAALIALRANLASNQRLAGQKAQNGALRNTLGFNHYCIGNELNARHDYAGALESFREASRIFEKLFAEGRGHASNSAKRLIRALVSVSRAALFARDFDESLSAASRALELDSGNPSIKIHLAHALMLLNRFDEAKAVYLENSAGTTDVKGRTFGQTVLDDFKALRAQGIEHPDMAKVEKLLPAASYDTILPVRN